MRLGGARSERGFRDLADCRVGARGAPAPAPLRVCAARIRARARLTTRIALDAQDRLRALRASQAVLQNGRRALSVVARLLGRRSPTRGRVLRSFLSPRARRQVASGMRGCVGSATAAERTSPAARALAASARHMVPVWSSWHEPARPEPAGLRVPFGGASCSRRCCSSARPRAAWCFVRAAAPGAAAGGAAADPLYGMRVVVSCL